MDPSNPDIKSCLDLCIISKGLLKYVVELVIDDGRLFTPHRAVRNKLIYSDHLSIHVKFKGIPEVIRSYKRMESFSAGTQTKKMDGKPINP